MKLIFAMAAVALNLMIPSVQAYESKQVKDDELVYMQTSEGLIIFQLLPHISPNHVKRFKNLVREGFYDGLGFYRVVDGFVAQGGQGETEWGNVKGKKSQYKSELNAEFTRSLSKEFHVIQSPALLAQETGFIDSIPAGRDLETKEEWFLHCPGMVAMARNNDINSASTEFYINIGQAPRHLDRNMSVFGRVVAGLDVAQKMQRGDKSKGGIVEPVDASSRILWAKLGTDITEGKKTVTVDSSQSKAFQERLKKAKHITHPFFIYPGNGNIDVCYYQPNVSVE